MADSQVHLFDPVERFIVGTVGEPGDRTFFIQARTGSRLVSVALEKTQVAALAERIMQIIKEVRISEPLVNIERILPDNQPLETPIDEEFRVGVIGIAYVSDRNMIEIDLQAITEKEPEEEEFLEINNLESQEILRVLISLGYSNSFAKRAQIVLGAGRAPCPFCGGPIDPGGHLCPRANGYRR
jgi:uncharacterized repeat protein (TIGR03847 family)